MNQGYRDDLAAAQARIAELEGQLAGASSGDVQALEREHAALVRSVPTRQRTRLMIGLTAFVTLLTLASMLFLHSEYDSHPRFQIAAQMLVICASITSAAMTWVGRVEGLRRVALSERLLAAERSRAALESRVRVADAMRVAPSEEAESLETSEQSRRSTHRS